jgi:16S rRNA (cytidine1402-2'-O)-methyltransferase
LSQIPGTVIFYEAPHRLAASLKDAREVLGEREAVVARELTKLHEEIKRGRLTELATHYAKNENPRGEFVVLIDRNVLDNETALTSRSIDSLVTEFEEQGLDHRAALKKAARELGISRAEAYRQLLAERART